MPVNLRIGSVFKRSFQILFHNIIRFGLFALFLHIADHLVFAIVQQHAIPIVWDWLSDFFIVSIVTAFVVHDVLQNLRGHQTGISSCIVNGFFSIVPVLKLTLAMVVIFGILCVPAGMLIWVSDFGPGEARFVSFVSALIVGSALTLTAMTPFIVRWFVAIPVIAFEKLNVRDCLKRSAELTRGARWRILGIIVVSYIGGWSLWFCALQIAGLGVSLFATENLFSDKFSAEILITIVYSSLKSVFSAIVSVVVYHDLCIAKDGLDSQIKCNTLECFRGMPLPVF